MDIRVVPYDHPDATKLMAEVQLEYVARYGSEDITPLDPAQFALPLGLFLVGYLDDVPVASGAWRAYDELESGDAEVKRMYVATSARGRGFARAILAELERTALEAGRRRVALVTGSEQPEAVALYRSSGYREIANFGLYKDEPECICFGKMLG